MKYLFLAFILGGCCFSSETTTERMRADTAYVVPPAINDTLQAIVYDTVVVGVEVVGHDTVTQVQYYPKTKLITVHAQPETVQVITQDTVQVTTIVKQSFWEDLKGVMVWILVALILIALVLWLLKRLL